MYKVQLDQFEGPLDLLLYFIRRDEIDIYDIPISNITSEYLQVIEDMKSMNLSIAGEFILMAATLMKIKSKLLLPRPILDEDGEPIDPRTQLVEQLLEFQQYKGLSIELSAMDRMPVITSYELKREAISLDYKKEHILQCFDGDGILSFKRLLSNCENKIEMIITFLALLDLIRLSKVTVFQNKLFDKIEIHQLEKN